MTAWDHRAATGNGAYQLYLYVNETEFLEAGPGPSTGPGRTRISWELGFIKVASSGGFGTQAPNCSWEVHLQAFNNGDTSGTAGVTFGANDPIGTRRALAVAQDWIFGHDPAGSGGLGINTMARVSTGVSLGTSQIGWGVIGMTSFRRDGFAPAAPQLISRTDTTASIRAFDSTDWGLGTTAAPAHQLQRSDSSNMASPIVTTYPTSGGGAAHAVAQSGLVPFKSYYFRNAHRARTGNWAYSSVLAVHSRPSEPPAPTVSSKTASSITVSAGNPTYIGPGILERQTQISRDNFATIVGSTTANFVISFSPLPRTTLHQIRTRVRNSEGWSDWSETLTAFTEGTPPSAPVGLSAYEIASTSFRLGLGTISDNGGGVPTQVRVKISTTASDTGLIRTDIYPQWYAPRITGLTKNTQYYVSQAAYNSVEGGGWGPYSGWLAVQTLSNVPNAPVLSVQAINASSATLSWAVPTDLGGSTITGYRVRVGSNRALTQNAREYLTNSNVLTQVVPDLSGTYYAEVWTETSNGRGSSSPLLSFTTTGGGSTSGVWWSGADGVPRFSEAWWSGADGVPRLSEVWWSGADGVPRLCGQ
ncbi:minor tail protein [Microbacterium phage Pabst]|nr:minor tail protein [Microbacterium phage Pabst]